MSENTEAVIEWRLAPEHQKDARVQEDPEWTEHSRWPAEGAEERRAFLEANQSEAGLFEFRVRQARTEGGQTSQTSQTSGTGQTGEKSPRLTLWLKRQTEGARLFWLSEPGKMPVPLQLWIPASVTTFFRSEPTEPGFAYPKCEVEVEAWFYERNQEDFERHLRPEAQVEG